MSKANSLLQYLDKIEAENIVNPKNESFIHLDKNNDNSMSLKSDIMKLKLEKKEYKKINKILKLKVLNLESNLKRKLSESNEENEKLLSQLKESHKSEINKTQNLIESLNKEKIELTEKLESAISELRKVKEDNEKEIDLFKNSLEITGRNEIEKLKLNEQKQREIMLLNKEIEIKDITQKEFDSKLLDISEDYKGNLEAKEREIISLKVELQKQEKEIETLKETMREQVQSQIKEGIKSEREEIEKSMLSKLELQFEKCEKDKEEIRSSLQSSYNQSIKERDMKIESLMNEIISLKSGQKRENEMNFAQNKTVYLNDFSLRRQENVNINNY